MSVKLGTLTLDLVARVSGFTQGMSQASTSAEREMRRVENSVVSANGAIKSLATTAAASFSVAQISNYADEFINLQNRLKLVTGSTQELTQATKDTYAIAQATAGSWDSTVQVYQRFAQNAKTLGINLSQVASLTDTVSKAIAISGGTAASSEAALVQFGQALSSGVLRGEEFNSIAEQAGGLRDAIARGLNLSAGDLRKWAADGKLTTDIVIKALQESKVSVDDLFNKTDFTGAQGFKKLSTASTLYVGELSKSTGASKAMYDSLSYLSENLEKVTSVAAVGAAYLAGTYIPVIYASVVAKKAKITSMIEEIQIENASIVQSQRKAQAEFNAAQAEMTRARDSVIAAEMEVNADRAVIASEIQRMQATVAATNVEKAQEAQRLNNQITDVGRTQSITRMAQLQQVQAIQVAELTALEAKLGATVVATSQQYTAARNVQASATARLTVATSELNVANAMTTRTSVGLMGALGGPVGLGLLVAGVAASMLLMRDNTNTATSALDIQKQSVDELAEAYSKMSMAKIIAEMDALKNKAQEAKNEANNALNSAYAVAPNVGNFGTEKQREQNKLLSDTIKELKAGSLDAAKALQELQKGGFTQDQLDKAQRYFATFEEQNNDLKTYNYQMVLANSYRETASGIYDETSDKISKLTKSLSRLNETYEVSYAQILKGAEVFLQVAENSGKSKDQIDAGKVALQKYSDGQITATQLSQEFLKYNLIPENQIDAFKKQVAQSDGYKKSVTRLNVELKKQNELRNEFQKQHQNVIAMKKAEIQETNKQIEAQEKLSALDKSYAQKNLDIDFSRINIKNHGLDMGKALVEFYDENKLSKTQKLSVEQLAIFQKNFSKQQELKNLENDITQDKKDQTKELEKQQKLQAKQAVLLAGNNEQTRNMLRVYQAFRSTGLPDKQSRVMTAQVGRENDFVSDAMFGSHKDRNNGYTNSGFISWQKGRSTQLMQYLQSQGVLDKKGNIEQTQDALDAQARFLVQEISTGKGYGKSKTALANDDLDYRSLEKIIGQNFIGWDYTGKYGLGATKASKHLAKQDNYHSQLSGILGSNPEIVSSSLKDISKIEDEAYKAKAKTEDDIRQLQAQFDTEAIQRSKERDEQINQAAILGQMDLIPKIKERYNQQELLASYQLELELNGYKWGEDQKIAYRRDIAKLEYDISGKYGAEELKLRKNGIDALAQYEIDEYRKTQQLKIAEYQMAFSQPLTELQAEVLDMQAKANMGGGYGAWALQNQYGKDLNSFGVEYGKNVKSINEDKTITDDAVRKQMLLDAEESFRLSKLKLNEKYTLLEQDLAQSQQETQLSAWGNLLGQAQNTWGQITQSIKDANGEQSASFKAAFLAQQMFALGSAYVSTHLAAIQAMAAPDMILFGQKVMASEAILTMGYANMALIGAQTITGMAHNGIDNIPKEGTWLLDKGERVVDSRTNGDLKQYLANRQSDGPKVTINNNASVDVSARQNSDGTLTIDVVERFIADSLGQPNSKIRKSLNRNTTATARR